MNAGQRAGLQVNYREYLILRKDTMNRFTRQILLNCKRRPSQVLWHSKINPCFGFKLKSYGIFLRRFRVLFDISL
ncbi:hypothetical protein SDC9_116609 [bioreactor metagenome]|uniref:Uncharacterized protein n=1 Tax=bioreactor metagenome TaxID=1076179 RepID=A0A645BYD7_9ZZZZ